MDAIRSATIAALVQDTKKNYLADLFTYLIKE